MDWIRLGSSGCDLAGTGGVAIPVSHKELAKHCKCDDAWLAIRGKVYNVTRYMDFHPGGELYTNLLQLFFRTHFLNSKNMLWKMLLSMLLSYLISIL